MGIVLANQKLVTMRRIAEFKENIGVLLISSLFILLAARLKLSDLQGLGWKTVLFLLVMLLIVRPAVVLLSTFRSGLSWQERLFLAWMAPRGIVAAAVSSIFALRLAAVDHPQAEMLVPLTFAVIVVTCTVYGLTSLPLARWLKLSQANPQGVLIVGAHDWARRIAEALQRRQAESHAARHQLRQRPVGAHDRAGRLLRQRDRRMCAKTSNSTASGGCWR